MCSKSSKSKYSSNESNSVVLSLWEREEELYHILIDIMRSPEMIKSISGSSLKKKLQ